MPNLFYLCKDDQRTNTKQTPDAQSQHKPATSGWDSGVVSGGTKTTQTGNLQHRNCNTGVFLKTQTTFFCLRHPRYVNKEKKTEKNGEKAYIYTFVQKRHMDPRHYWCSVYTQTRCRDSRNRLFELFELHADFLRLRRRLKGEEDVFLKRCLFCFFFTTLDTSWEHRKFMAKFYNRHQF